MPTPYPHEVDNQSKYTQGETVAARSAVHQVQCYLAPTPFRSMAIVLSPEASFASRCTMRCTLEVLMICGVARRCRCRSQRTARKGQIYGCGEEQAGHLTYGKVIISSISLGYRLIQIYIIAGVRLQGLRQTDRSMHPAGISRPFLGIKAKSERYL